MAHPILRIPVRDPFATRRLARGALIAVNALILAACSTMKADQAPPCHGERRPANPHGSVLAPEAGAAARSLAPGSAGACGRLQP